MVNTEEIAIDQLRHNSRLIKLEDDMLLRNKNVRHFFRSAIHDLRKLI